MRDSAALALLTALAIAAAPALAQQQPQRQTAQAPGQAQRTSPLGALGSSNTKEPIKIDADRLDVFERDGKAVFAGNVVAVQGDTTMRCSTLTVFYEQQRAQAGNRPAAPAPAAGAQGDAIRKIDCKGPVTVVQKDQIATGDNAVFDRAANKVLLDGNVALSQGKNVTKGEKLVYDLNTGIANVETKPGGRVRALFVPGEQNATPAQQGQQGQKPRQ
jgi:lipopolysaccharide export system protein LptA